VAGLGKTVAVVATVGKQGVSEGKLVAAVGKQAEFGGMLVETVGKVHRAAEALGEAGT